MPVHWLPLPGKAAMQKVRRHSLLFGSRQEVSWGSWRMITELTGLAFWYGTSIAYVWVSL